MIRTLLFLVIATLPATAAETVLVEGGKSQYAIVAGAAPGEVEKFAAEELAKYLRQMTRADVPVLAAAKKNAPAIYVGRAGAERGAKFPTSAEAEINDEFRIRFDGRDLVLAGATQRGTLYAVYAFLERLGCRWFAPHFEEFGISGEVVPHAGRLALDTLDINERPSFKYRKKYVEEGRSHNVPNLRAMVDWLAKVRANVLVAPIDYQGQGRAKWDNWRAELVPELRKRGFIVEIGGHGYQNFLPQEKYFDAHPEWFGTVNGKRSRQPNLVFATSNADAMRQFLANVLAYLESHPEINIFDLWPPDGARWSDAPEDVALGTPTVRHAQVVNRVAEAVREKFPLVKVEFIAYSSYLEAPPGVVFAGNTTMDFCPINRSFEVPLFDESAEPNKVYMDALRTWLKGGAFRGDISLYSYYPKYAWRSLPAGRPRQVAKEAAFFAKLGVKGWDSYSEPGNWFTYEPQHYIVARASWNASLEAEEALADYARLRYGSAAAPVGEYLALIERVVVSSSRIPGTALKTLEQMRGYIKELQDAGALLKKAAAVAEPGPADLIGRLETLRQYALIEARIRALHLDQSQRMVRGGTKQMQELLEARLQLFTQNQNKGIFLEHPRQLDF